MTLSTSYCPADRSQPVLDLAVGDALRDAAAEAPHTTALVERAVDPAARRRWSYADCRLDPPALPSLMQGNSHPIRASCGSERSTSQARRGYPDDPQWRAAVASDFRNRAEADAWHETANTTMTS
jgi:hypothetical protein